MLMPIVSTGQYEGYLGENVVRIFYLQKKLDIHMEIHVNETKRMVIMFKCINVYCTEWYIIHHVSKSKML